MSNKSLVGVIVAVVVVIGLGYLLFAMSPTNDTDTGVGSNVNNDQGQPAISVPVTPKEVIVTIASQNSSEQSGTAMLTEAEGKVSVVLDLQGGEASEEPAHIHIGACPNPGSITYPLNPVVSGKSTTVINTTLAELKTSLPLAINVHKSAEEISTYVACGDIVL